MRRSVRLRGGLLCVVVLAGVLVLPGCSFVSTVAGRSAAVLPEGDVCLTQPFLGDGWGGGISLFPPTGFLHIAQTKGIGRRSDVQVGASVVVPLLASGNLFGVLRHQFLGRPLDLQAVGTGHGVDMSAEVGAGFAIATRDYGTAYFPGNVRLGLNMSVRQGRAIPYVSYRFHLGTSDLDTWTPFTHQTVFVGVETLRREKPGSVAFEIFYWWGDDEALLGDWGPFNGMTWGLNVVIRASGRETLQKTVNGYRF